jgi:hypothetical protein
VDEEELTRLDVVAGVGLEESDVVRVDELDAAPMAIGLEGLLAAEPESVTQLRPGFQGREEHLLVVASDEDEAAPA